MRYLVFGGTGLLGSAITQKLMQFYPDDEIVSLGSMECNLLSFDETCACIARHQPDMIFHAAGRVGGIKANATNQYKFLTENARMAISVIDNAKFLGVKKLAYVSSSCAYPLSDSLLTPDMLMGGKLEPTNLGYAYAKNLGMHMTMMAHAEGLDYKTFVPCNLYGLGDNFEEGGHVFAAMIRKTVDAMDSGLPEIKYWGDGSPKREFLYNMDAATGIINGFKHLSDPVINVGYGVDMSIKELAEMIADRAGYTGEISFNGNKAQNGAPKKLMNSNPLARMQWSPLMTIEDGIDLMIANYMSLKIIKDLENAKL